MAYAAMKKEVLNFDTGTHYEVMLKYPTGKQVSNGRIMFSTTDEAVFFVDPDVADKIYELQLRPNEKLRIIRRGGRNGSLEVSKASEQPVTPQSIPAAPTVTTVPEAPTLQAPQQSQNSSFSRIMASSYIAAIDALLVAHDYAESKGIQFKLSPGEIRASAHCIYISATRGGR